MEYLLKKPCKKCGGLEATKHRACKYCVTVYLKDYAKTHTNERTLAAKAWRGRNPEYHSMAVKRYISESRKTLSNNTVKGRLTMIAKDSLKLELAFADIPEELIEIKRLQLQLTRLIRTQSL